ncbi:MAG: hypothetical protein HFJ86_04490 [Oscillospiraceae bacterium]|jgi:hypothetical protein|nr:hypothetical protein [Oscillospiraceae bacterium]
MRTKMIYRGVAAFISLVLIALCAFVLPVGAVEGEGPTQGGIQADKTVVDFGTMNRNEILANSKLQAQVGLTNMTGERLTRTKVLHRASASGEFQEVAADAGQMYNGSVFCMYGPASLDASGELQTMQYIVAPIRSKDVIISREEPYEEAFQLVFADASGNEYTVEYSVTMTVTDGTGETHINKVNPNNGTLWIYMNEKLIQDASALRDLTWEDFTVTAQDEGGETVSLENLRIDYDTAQNAVKMYFDEIVSDTARIITVSVQFREEAAKTADFEVFAMTTESNVPEDGNVTVKVIDHETKEPVAGAPVLLAASGVQPLTVATDAQGYARFSGLEAGTYSLSIHMDGYEDVDMASPDLTSELLVELSRPGDLAPGEAANIQILVKNQYGEPVSDATVQFYCPANKGRGAAQTNGQGVATFRLNANNYEITVTKSGHFPSGSKILSVTHREETLEVVLEQRFMCSVMTTVVDESGRPVSGALVYYTCPTDNDLGRSTTGSNGKTSEWISIRANDYVLKVSKTGYETYEKNVRVSEANAEFTVTLLRSRAVDDDRDYSSSGSSSSDKGGSTAKDKNVNSKNQVVASEINRQILQGIKEQSSAGQKATVEVKVKNAGSITPAALKSMRLTTEASGGKAKLLADSTTPDGKVAARLYIDPAKSFYVDKEIKLGVSMEKKDVQKTQDTFEKHFDNKVSVVHFEHQGTFGMNIDAAVKVDLSGLNTKNLMFYSYDPATNRYAPIKDPNAYVDENGFLHFTTSIGGDLVITDKPLTSRK